MKTTRALLVLAALALLCPPAPRVSAFGYTYKIYCVEGIVSVEHKTREALARQSRGTVCELARTGFTSLTKARLAAKRFGGIGAPCRCSAASRAKS